MNNLLSALSCGCDSKDNGMNPMLLIVLLLCLCGGDNNLFGGCGNDCGCGRDDSCGCGSGLGGILPLILILYMCNGSCSC